MPQDLRVPMDPILEAFGVAASVTLPPPDDAVAIDATLVWLSPAQDFMPGGGEVRRSDPQRRAALTLAEVARLPRLTRIEAPEVKGGTTRAWRVDATERVEYDHVVVVVVPIDEAS